VRVLLLGPEDAPPALSFVFMTYNAGKSFLILKVQSATLRPKFAIRFHANRGQSHRSLNYRFFAHVQLLLPWERDTDDRTSSLIALGPYLKNPFRRSAATEIP